ncbi:MAG: protein-methionine-sulfoxide reductase heme-binding subunit MsrQ [Pseudomonadota bacterium]
MMRWPHYTRAWIYASTISNMGVLAKRDSVFLAKLLIWLFALGYCIYLIGGIFADYLGANPIEAITHQTGEWGLHFLLASLSISTLRRRLYWNQLQKLRRLLGLWSFAFIVLHFFTFIFFDHFFYLPSIIEDVVDRPYITVGFAAFLLLIPLAVTSTRGFQRSLGKYWLRLHRLVYGVAILGILHYWWLVKADSLYPLIYSFILLLLFAERLFWRLQKRAHSVK